MYFRKRQFNKERYLTGRLGYREAVFRDSQGFRFPVRFENLAAFRRGEDESKPELRGGLLCRTPVKQNVIRVQIALVRLFAQKSWL
jgi:hypothetical protein